MRLPITLLALLAVACGSEPPPAAPPAPAAAFDPLLQAAKSIGRIANREAVIPPQCYTRTDGVSNPCWACHTGPHGLNAMDDAALQEEYAFSTAGKTNHWSNLFVDRTAAIAAIPDAEALAWVRQDNYTPLLEGLRSRPDLLGWRPDLDYREGFDEQGFARDGSGWRAFRYAPFPGTFWPTNGSTDDVLVRLPRAFRSDMDGKASAQTYVQNLAILEAAMAENDGELPSHYAGAAQAVPVTRHLFPAGTEFLHTVRYLDPDAPGAMARRMKEVRYSVKQLWVTPAEIARVYAEERAAKNAGLLPAFRGTPLSGGLLNDFGWQLQAYIEDAQGRLRLQTHEEHLYCMGCHSTIGVTADQTFAFVRKPPGAAGWGYQSLAGMKARPQAGQREAEVLAWLRRAGGGDEFRANDEMLERFFPGGALDEAAVRAAPDLAALLLPSRGRALALDKAYMLLVREQSFDRGRDAVIGPAARVHRSIDNGDTGLNAYRDGRLPLDW